MKKTPTIVVTCATAAMLGAAAFAGNQGGGSQSSSRSSQQPASAQPNSSLQHAQAQQFFRSSKIVGQNAQDSRGQKIGEVKDVAFNQQGEIFALVDVGNSRMAVVPWQAIKTPTTAGGQNLVINTTQQQLKNAPSVTKEQWGALNNPQFTQGLYSYYHVQGPTAMGGSESPSGTMQGQGGSSQGAAPSQGQPPGQSQRQQQPGASEPSGSSPR